MPLAPEAARVELRFADASWASRFAQLERLAHPAPWSEQSFRFALARATTIALAAVDGAVLAGYVLGRIAADEAQLLNVVVAPDRRGAGLGRRMVDCFLDECRARHATQCVLEVRESNGAARAIYAAAGFRVAGRRRNYYDHPREDALTMTCPLDANRSDSTDAQR